MRGCQYVCLIRMYRLRVLLPAIVHFSAWVCLPAGCHLRNDRHNKFIIEGTACYKTQIGLLYRQLLGRVRRELQQFVAWRVCPRE